MFVSVGSHSNVDDSDTHPEEYHRADVLQFTPEGKFEKVQSMQHFFAGVEAVFARGVREGRQGAQS